MTPKTKVLLLTSALAILLFVSRYCPSRTEFSIAAVQLPSDDAWNESQFADDEFLGLATPTLKARNEMSRHFSGALAMNDIVPKSRGYLNDGQHPMAEELQDSKVSAPHWAKKLILDHETKLGFNVKKGSNRCPPGTFCSLVSHLNDVHLGGNLPIN